MTEAPGDRRKRLAHNRAQQETFERVAHFFGAPIPEDVLRRMQAIVDAANLQPGEAVLDVGTGTGALLPLILEKAPGRLLACDLSREMLRGACRRFGRQVTFYRRDVVDLAGKIEPVDVVFCNACFANLYDQVQTLRSIRRLLNHGGRVLITHPMGREFVLNLKREDPAMVPHELPEESALRRMFHEAGLELERFVDQPQLYIAVGSKA